MSLILFEHIQKNFDETPVIKIGVNSIACRFCKSLNSTYANRSHSIPEFLGNKSIFTLDECDKCNKFFGEKYERELNKFVPPSCFTRLKGKKGYRKYQASNGIEITSGPQVLNIKSTKENTGSETIDLKGRAFSALHVYKGLMKIMISLVPNSHLHEVDELIEWMMSKSDFDKLNHKPIVVFGLNPPSSLEEDKMDVLLVRHDHDGCFIYEFIATFNFFYLSFAVSLNRKCSFKMMDRKNIYISSDKTLLKEIDLSSGISKHNFRFVLNNI